MERSGKERSERTKREKRDLGDWLEEVEENRGKRDVMRERKKSERERMWE